MEESEQNRSEAPSPFKLQRAREKGSVARGMDLGFLTGLATFAGFAWATGAEFADGIALAAHHTFVTAPMLASGGNELMAVIGILFASVARPLAIMAIAIFLVVCLFEMLQTGIVFTTQPLKPDFTRLNPAKGLKRIFSVRLLIETLKNVLKMGAYCTVAYFAIRHSYRSIAAIDDAGSLLSAMAGAGFRLLAYFLGVALFFAAIDQLIVRRDFLKQMRMSRREVRRESRDREGDPRLKQKRKQLHGEFAQISQSLRGIPGADILITNPTHYAVALRYDPNVMLAPKIVARGSNRLALRLKALAFAYQVIIVQDKALARELFHKGRLNGDIPEASYRRVADIYLDVRKKQSRKDRTVHA